MIAGVYVIQRIDAAEFYIGSSVNMGKRWREHCGQLRRGAHHAPRLQNLWNKHGAVALEFAVLEVVTASASLLGREQVWIDRFDPAYNTCRVAGSALGVKRTAEQNAANAERARSRKRGPLSIEHRAKLAAAMTGQTRPPKSEQWRADHSARMKGRAVTDEQRAVLSERATGRKHDPATKEAIRAALKASWVRRRAAEAAK